MKLVSPQRCSDQTTLKFTRFGGRKKNPQGSSWELNLGPSNYQSDALTTEPLDPRQSPSWIPVDFSFSLQSLHQVVSAYTELSHCITVSPPSPCFFLLPPLSANFTISGSVPPRATQMQNALLCWPLKPQLVMKIPLIITSQQKQTQGMASACMHVCTPVSIVPLRISIAFSQFSLQSSLQMKRENVKSTCYRELHTTASKRSLSCTQYCGLPYNHPSICESVLVYFNPQHAHVSFSWQ